MTQSEIDRRIADLQDEKSKLYAQKSENERLLTSTLKTSGDIDNDIKDLNARKADLKSTMDRANNDINNIESQISRLNSQIEDLHKEKPDDR